jgi:hypothetical protein
MSKRQIGWTIASLMLAASMAWGQSDSTQGSNSGQPDSTAQQPDSTTQQPVPAYGQENAPAPISENPPITGLDQPSLEPHAAPLSYLQPGATASESATTNIGNTLGGGQAVRSVTRALGFLILERLWSHYDLALDYVGGAGFYNAQGYGFKSLQELDFDQKVNWKRGQLAVRDSFNYLPEGNFGSAYGALGGTGIGGLGTIPFTPGVLGVSALGTLGQAPRVVNESVVDVEQSLTPKSTVTAAAAYGFTHFYGTDATSGTTFLNSSEGSVIVGYDRILTPRTQVAIAAAYQNFDFSIVGTRFHSEVVQLLYGHRISGKMDFSIGAGPELIHLDLPCSGFDVLLYPQCHQNPTTLAVYGSYPDQRVGAAGRAQLRYQFPKTKVDLSYIRLLTTGSGLLAGAQTDAVRADAGRPLSRVWDGFVDLGYSRNSREGLASSTQGVNAAIFQNAFAGAGVHRSFGREFHGYATYQFNTLWLDNSYCGTATACNRTSNRQVLTVGLDWTPRPIRLD